MANVRLATAAQNDALDAVTILINATSAGSIKIYDGTQPANANTAISTQTLLATLAFSTDAFGDAVAGVSTAAAITGDSSVDADGTATWARVVDGGGNTIMDVDAGTASTIMILNAVAFVTGGTVDADSMTLTMPANL